MPSLDTLRPSKLQVWLIAGESSTRSDRDYTYYSTVHDLYTRIDLLYIDQPALELLKSLSIGHITISDHAPITVTLAMPTGSHRAWTWRLNENLLDDLVVETRISDTLKTYFWKNTAGDLSEGLGVSQGCDMGRAHCPWHQIEKGKTGRIHRVFSALQQAELKNKSGGEEPVIRPVALAGTQGVVRLYIPSDISYAQNVGSSQPSTEFPLWRCWVGSSGSPGGTRRLFWSLGGRQECQLW